MEKQQLETLVKDIVNAGIGAVDNVKKASEEGFSSLNLSYDNLKTSGAADNSAEAVKIREGLDKLLSSLEELRAKSETTLKEGEVKLKELAAKVEETFPGFKFDEVQAKINELSDQAQVQFNEISDKTKELVGQLNLDQVKAQFDSLVGKFNNKAEAKKEEAAA